MSWDAHETYVELLGATEEGSPDGPVLLKGAGDELFRPGALGVDDSAGGTLRRWSDHELKTIWKVDTHLVLPGAVGAEPVGAGTTGLHLCQICTAEPNGGRSCSYVSTVTAVGDRDGASLERAAEGETGLESDESTAVVE